MCSLEDDDDDDDEEEEEDEEDEEDEEEENEEDDKLASCKCVVIVATCPKLGRAPIASRSCFPV